MGHGGGVPLDTNEIRHVGMSAQPRQSRCVGPARSVAFGGDHAQEAQRLVERGAELVPGGGGDANDVEGSDLVDLSADKGASPAAEDDNDVYMRVAFKSGMSTDVDLEVAQLRWKRRVPAEEDLPRNVAKVRPRLFFVGEQRGAVPSKAVIEP